MLVRIFVGYLTYTVGLGYRDDIQHPQFADLDVVTTSKSYDMPQPKKRYTATNNLHTHIKSHEGVKLQEGNAGGRVAQKVIDKAVRECSLTAC